MSIKPFDFHTHSVFCDGKNTLEEMTCEAVKKGFAALGFSGHSFTSFDTSYCIKDEAEYFNRCKRLKEEYADRISLFCGIERDYYADRIYTDLDYVIGSVHYVKADDSYIPVDLREGQQEAVKKHFGGDYLSFAEEYYETLGKLCRVHPTDIVGHFDLIKIFNSDGKLFDESCRRYKESAFKAADALLGEDVLFEINTGGVFRGRRTDPYPSRFILEYIAAKGGKVTISGDSHQTSALGFEFEKSLKLAKECGFDAVYTFAENGKKKIKL